jgi:excisionase family DNA binding protein
MTEGELITIKELMGMLKISLPTAYRYIEQKKFEVYKIGGGLRINKQSVLDFLSRNRV